jgi:hypothetical protein
MTAETLARQLMVDLFTKWPEHGRKRMRDMVEDALPAIIAAARAEEAAKGLTMEALSGAILDSGWVHPSLTEAAEAAATDILAALTPTPPPPAATVERCAECGDARGAIVHAERFGPVETRHPFTREAGESWSSVPFTPAPEPK